MFVINEDKSIYITRGDVAFFSVEAKTDTGEAYKFQAGDVVRFKVFEKKACDNVVLQKDFGIEAETDEVGIYLEKKDTKFGNVISKPTDYWYEVELNPYTDAQTLIGYDEDGAKVFKLFPEGSEAEDNDPITPEDIPVVDEDLDLTSTRPVQNQAIARAILKINEDVQARIDGLEIEVGEGLRNAGGNKVINVADPTEDDDAANKRYVDGAVAESLEYVDAHFVAQGGQLDANNMTVKNVATPTADTDAVNKKYADEHYINPTENISESFIAKNVDTGNELIFENITVEKNVMKQGNLIIGNVVVVGDLSSAAAIFNIASDYKPSQDVLALAISHDADGNVLTGNNVAYILKANGSVVVNVLGVASGSVARMLINFTYFCK